MNAISKSRGYAAAGLLILMSAAANASGYTTPGVLLMVIYAIYLARRAP